MRCCCIASWLMANAGFWPGIQPPSKPWVSIPKPATPRSLNNIWAVANPNPGKCIWPPKSYPKYSRGFPHLSDQPVDRSTKLPWGTGPHLFSQSTRWSTLRRRSASAETCFRTSNTTAGATKDSGGYSSIPRPLAWKLFGAFIWVPLCSPIVKLLRPKPSESNDAALVNLTGGSPGQSGMPGWMGWLRPTTVR